MTLYFNTAAIGRPSTSTLRYLRAFHEVVNRVGPRSGVVTEFVEAGFAAGGHIAAEGGALSSWGGLDDLARKLKTLSGFPLDSSVVFTQGTSAALQLVLRGCDGREAVGLTDVEHQSEVVVAKNVVNTRIETIRVSGLLERSDAKMRIIDTILTAARRLDVLIISHVTAADGIILPLNEIVSSVRESYPDVRVIVDGAHGLGHVEVDSMGVLPDAYVGSGHKWLEAPATSGFALLPVGSEIAATNTLKDLLVSGILVDGEVSDDRIYWGPATLDCGAVTGLGVELSHVESSDRSRKRSRGRANRKEFEFLLAQSGAPLEVHKAEGLERGNISLVRVSSKSTTLAKALARWLEKERGVVCEGIGLGMLRFSFTGSEEPDDLHIAADALCALANGDA